MFWRPREPIGPDLPRMLPAQQADGFEGDVRSLCHRPIDQKTQTEGTMNINQSTLDRPLTSADTMMRDLSEALHDVLRETDDSYIEKDPEDAFVDLAARLVHRLSGRIALVPVPHQAKTEAAKRIFDVFTTWMQMQPDRAYVTRLNETSGKFEVTTLSPNGVQAFFQGSDTQDACAQMAQVLLFNGGTL
jgi:hypothetical protein